MEKNEIRESEKKTLRYNFRGGSTSDASSSNQYCNRIFVKTPSEKGSTSKKRDFNKTKNRLLHDTKRVNDCTSMCEEGDEKGGGSENSSAKINVVFNNNRNKTSGKLLHLGLPMKDTPSSSGYRSANEDNINNDNSSSMSKASKEHRIRDEIGSDGKWEIRTYTGYIVTLQVNLDRDMPKNFLSDKAEVMWHTANEINLIRLKRQVQYGEYIPDDAIVKVDSSPLTVPNTNSRELVVESEETRKEKVKEWGNKKETALLAELSVVEKALNLRDCFCGEHQLEKGLALLDDFDKLELTPLILKKNPFVVDTLRCLCSYQKVTNLDMMEILIPRIQEKAKDIYNKIQMLFHVPEETGFEDYFKKQSTFLWRVHGFDVQRVYELVNDPTLPILEHF